jgi:pimeloyl-ACP methyl ester carboxylesterase
VGLLERTFRVRVDDTVDVEISIPLDADGEPADGAFPAVVFVHGGLVDVERYRWLTTHIASRGFVVLAPRHALDLAIFETSNTLDALARLRGASARDSGPLAGLVDERPALTTGHSLGGVVAGKAYLRDPGQVRYLAMLASVPAGGDDFTDRETGDGRILSITGSRDRSLLPDRAAEGVEQMREGDAPVTFAVVEGMNHYQWTEAPSASDLDGDGTPTIDTETARRRALVLLDALLEIHAGRDSALLDEPSRWPEGVEPSVGEM